jgi:hypothetical protein
MVFLHASLPDDAPASAVATTAKSKMFLKIHNNMLYSIEIGLPALCTFCAPAGVLHGCHPVWLDGCSHYEKEKSPWE